jgi:uncharacterized protein (TIGR00299 family) protein
MSKLLYFDCFSGISGDMLLGALLDAGLPLDELRRALGSLAVAGYDIEARKVLRASVSATKFLLHQRGVSGASGAGDGSASDGSGAHFNPASNHASNDGSTEGSDSRSDGVSHHRSHEHSHDRDHDAAHLAPSHTDEGPGDDNPEAHTHGHAHDDGGGHAHDHEAAHEHRHAQSAAQGVSRAEPRGLGGPDPHSHPHSHPHRSLPEIFKLIDGSALSAAGRHRAKALFRRLAEAEAAIHQMPVEQVHLHEVGALDSIIDIVGVVFGLEWIGAETIVCSPLNVGGGMVNSAHGVFPVPAPATVSLLGAAPIYGGATQHELVTPTGALIVSDYASSFGPIPAMTIERVGYGAGSHDFPSTPNVLRLLIGSASVSPNTDRVTVIECEIDDMNPQLFGVVMERLYAAGALEVFYVAVQMKKNRPGTLLTVVAPPALRSALTDIVFRETTTIGLRYADVDRECLPRETVTVETALGPVRFKLARRDGRIVNAAPEFEDCARLAAAHQVSVKDVQALAVQTYGDRRDLDTPERPS